jgi:hypothetical protein
MGFSLGVVVLDSSGFRILGSRVLRFRVYDLRFMVSGHSF